MFVGQVLRQRAAGEVRPAVDDHAAAAADAGAADEVERERRVELLADLVERDEQRHARRFLELEHVDVRHARRVLRVVPQDVEVQHPSRASGAGVDAAVAASDPAARTALDPVAGGGVMVALMR